MEVLLVRLAGLRRIEAVISRLVDLLGADDDAMTSSAQRALIEIGTDAVVHQIAERFPGEEWSWQLYATGVLETIGLPSSEEALLSLCERILRSGNEAMLGSALLRQFSERGIPVVRQFVLDGYDSTMDALEESLPAVAQVLGVEFPLDAAWQSAIERCQTERDARWKTFREAFRKKQSASPVRNSDLIDDYLMGEDDFSDPPLATATFIRRTDKVGRNDPCPCGSGKKYKKCCGVTAARGVQ